MEHYIDWKNKQRDEAIIFRKKGIIPHQTVCATAGASTCAIDDRTEICIAPKKRAIAKQMISGNGMRMRAILLAIPGGNLHCLCRTRGPPESITRARMFQLLFITIVIVCEYITIFLVNRNNKKRPQYPVSQHTETIFGRQCVLFLSLFFDRILLPYCPPGCIAIRGPTFTTGNGTHRGEKKQGRTRMQQPAHCVYHTAKQVVLVSLACFESLFSVLFFWGDIISSDRPIDRRRIDARYTPNRRTESSALPPACSSL